MLFKDIITIKKVIKQLICDLIILFIYLHVNISIFQTFKHLLGQFICPKSIKDVSNMNSLNEEFFFSFFRLGGCVSFI